MTQKRIKFKQFGGLLSAIAVALSLVFVGLEVRETARQTQLNTEAIQIAAYQDLIAQISNLNELLLDPELGSFYLRLSGRDLSLADLSPAEAFQARRWHYLFVRHADMAFYQFERGLLSEERLESTIGPFILPLRAPVRREIWENQKSLLVPDFQEYVDGRLAEFDAELADQE